MGIYWEKDSNGSYTKYIVNGVDMLAHGYTPDFFKEHPKRYNKEGRISYVTPEDITEKNAEWMAEFIKAKEEMFRRLDPKE